MGKSRKWSVSRRVLLYEVIAFGSMLLIHWLDELIDIPAKFLGAAPTPTNWREALFESVVIISAALLTILMTLKLFAKIKHLEGLLPTCASCKKIRDEQGNWKPIETYIGARSEAEFSHGLCPECVQELYGDYLKGEPLDAAGKQSSGKS